MRGRNGSETVWKNKIGHKNRNVRQFRECCPPCFVRAPVRWQAGGALKKYMGSRRFLPETAAGKGWVKAGRVRLNPLRAAAGCNPSQFHT